MKWLNRQIDISSLVFFRIAFGILAVAEMTAQITYKRWYMGYYSPDEFHFNYIGFEFIQPFPEPFMSLFLIVLWLTGFCILFGYRYRIATIVFAFGYTYTYLLEKGLYLNHGYLYCWLAFVMIFLPAHRSFSFDVRREPSLAIKQIPYWPIFTLCFLMGVVYFFGGIAKMNTDWINGIPLTTWVGNKSSMPILGWLWALPATGLFMSWSGLFLDFCSPFLLSWKKTRPFIFIALLMFHLINSLLFKIGIFPWLSLSLTALFFDPSWPRKWWNYLKNNYQKAAQLNNWFASKLPKAANQDPSLAINKSGLLLLSVIILFHITVPLRHHLFPGPVSWTEEGHRYSWRMMLRSKAGYGHFIVRETGTDRNAKEKPKDWMLDKLSQKLYSHPDMIWQFAQHLAQEYEAKGWNKPQVYASIRANLNQHGYQKYIDQSIDLAAIEWNLFKSNDWIVPMKLKGSKPN